VLRGRGRRGSSPNLPRTWHEIGVGDLVVAQEEDPTDGWYEAIVVEVTNDMFTLRWRDYPRGFAGLRGIARGSAWSIRDHRQPNN